MDNKTVKRKKIINKNVKKYTLILINWQWVRNIILILFSKHMMEIFNIYKTIIIKESTST